MTINLQPRTCDAHVVQDGYLDFGFLILGCGLLTMAEMAIGASNNTHLAIRAEQGKSAASVVIGFR